MRHLGSRRATGSSLLRWSLVRQSPLSGCYTASPQEPALTITHYWSHKFSSYPYYYRVSLKVCHDKHSALSADKSRLNLMSAFFCRTYLLAQVRQRHQPGKKRKRERFMQCIPMFLGEPSTQLTVHTSFLQALICREDKLLVEGAVITADQV